MVDTIRLEDGDILLNGGDIAIHTDCCCVSGNCVLCTSTPSPVQVEVEFTGIADDNSCDDGNCSDYNNVPFITTIGANHCVWSLTSSGFDCDAESLAVRILFTGVVGTSLTIQVSLHLADGVYYWRKNYGAVSTVDCNWIDEDIPWSAPPGFPGDFCDGSASSCTINAL